MSSSAVTNGAIPENSCDANTNTGDSLETKFFGLVDEASSLPVALTYDSIEVRTKFDGPHLVAVADAKVDQPPSALKGYLENFIEAVREDPMVETIQSLGVDPNDSHQREGIKVHLQFPFPLSKRVMVHWKYLTLNRNNQKDEHLLILSEHDNEGLMENHFTKEDEDDYVFARIFLCAYHITPTKDSESNIVGSNLKYLYSGDMGGMIPKMAQDWVTPQTMLDSIHSWINYGKKSSEQKLAS